MLGDSEHEALSRSNGDRGRTEIVGVPAEEGATPRLTGPRLVDGGGGGGGGGGEQYEDSKGNVLTRSQYQDLARQGML